MKSRLLGIVWLAAGAAFGGDAQFERIVKAIESHYGTHQVHIPFMGMADFVLKVAHPEGASGFKLAVFEDLKSTPGEREWAERDHFMNSLCDGDSLHALVRVHSRRSGEATYIFADPSRTTARILIATFERNEATVVEVKGNIDRLLNSLDEPGHAARKLSGRDHDEDQ